MADQHHHHDDVHPPPPPPQQQQQHLVLGIVRHKSTHSPISGALITAPQIGLVQHSLPDGSFGFHTNLSETLVQVTRQNMLDLSFNISIDSNSDRVVNRPIFLQTWEETNGNHGAQQETFAILALPPPTHQSSNLGVYVLVGGLLACAVVRMWFGQQRSSHRKTRRDSDRGGRSHRSTSRSRKREGTTTQNNQPIDHFQALVDGTGNLVYHERVRAECTVNNLMLLQNSSETLIFGKL